MKIRDISTWESFYHVAKDASFTSAAKKLSVGTSLLSKRITRLEDDLGVRLFHRSTRKVRLTKDGEALLPQVETMLSDLTSLEEKFQKNHSISGTIRMTCVTSVAHKLIAPVLVEFMKLHPGIRFEFNSTDEILDLIDNQLDLAVRVQGPTGADFVFTKLLENNLVVCASPKYLKTLTREIRRPEDLLAHPILTLRVYENCRFIKTGFPLSRLNKNRMILCESGLYLTELALQGSGIAIRSHWDVKAHLESGKLVQLLANHQLESFKNLYAVVPTRRLMSLRVRTFLDFLVKKLAKS